MSNTLLQNAMQDWFSGLNTPALFTLLVVVVAFGSYVLERLVLTVLKQRSRGTETTWDDVIVKALHPGLMVAVFVTTIWLALRYIDFQFDPLTAEIIRNVGATLIALSIGLGVVRLASGLLRLPAKKNPRWFPLSTIGVRIASAVLWTIILIVILNQYGVEITPLLATLGVASLAVGLALGPTLQNFFAGLWIQSGENLRPGHFIRLENHKLEGFIQEVGWRTTRIRTLPGNLVIVPNQEMSQSVITNFSLPADKMGTSITIVTGFETDPDQIVKILLEEANTMARELDYVLSDPPPAARLNRRESNGWEFWCGFWVSHFWHQWNAQGQMLQRLRARFLREGLRMPLPIAEEYRVPDDRVDVSRGIVSGQRAGHGQGDGAGRPESPAPQPPGPRG